MKWDYSRLAAVKVMDVTRQGLSVCQCVPNSSESRALIQVRIQGVVSIRKTVLPGMAIPMLKIRRPNGRLIFNMEITIRR